MQDREDRHKRCAVGLTRHTYQIVENIAAAEKISRMEVIRRGVNAYLALKAMDDATAHPTMEVRG